MCGSRKYSYSPYGRSLEIPRGRGGPKHKRLEEKYDATLVFPGGEGVQKTSHGGEGMDIFWSYTIWATAYEEN